MALLEVALLYNQSAADTPRSTGRLIFGLPGCHPQPLGSFSEGLLHRPCCSMLAVPAHRWPCSAASVQKWRPTERSFNYCSAFAPEGVHELSHMLHVLSLAGLRHEHTQEKVPAMQKGLVVFKSAVVLVSYSRGHGPVATWSGTGGPIMLLAKI